MPKGNPLLGYTGMDRVRWTLPIMKLYLFCESSNIPFDKLMTGFCPSEREGLMIAQLNFLQEITLNVTGAIVYIKPMVARVRRWAIQKPQPKLPKGRNDETKATLLHANRFVGADMRRYQAPGTGGKDPG